MREDFAPAASAFAFSARSASSGDIADSLLQRHRAQEATLNDFLRERQQLGELAADTDTEALSRYLVFARVKSNDVQGGTFPPFFIYSRKKTCFSSLLTGLLSA